MCDDDVTPVEWPSVRLSVLRDDLSTITVFCRGRRRFFCCCFFIECQLLPAFILLQSSQLSPQTSLGMSGTSWRLASFFLFISVMLLLQQTTPKEMTSQHCSSGMPPPLNPFSFFFISIQFVAQVQRIWEPEILMLGLYIFTSKRIWENLQKCITSVQFLQYWSGRV